MTDNTHTTPADYRDAIAVQSACSLSGIVNSLNAVLPKIWNEARSKNQGTDYVAHHPIVLMYTTQILYLSFGALLPVEALNTYDKAYTHCREQSTNA